MTEPSRQCKAVKVGRDVAAGEGVTAISLLDECIAEWGKPMEVLVGHDAQYYDVRGGKSRFDSRLEELGIKHILAAVGKPTTTGKIERWFGTYDREAWRFEALDDFCSTTTRSGLTSP